MNLLELMATEFWGNSVEAYLTALLLFAFYKLIFWFFKNFLVKKFKSLTQKTKTRIDDIVADSIKRIPGVFFSFVALYLALESLVLEAHLNKMLHLVFSSYVIFQIIATVQPLIKYFLGLSLKGTKKAETDETFLYLSNLAINVILWTIAVLLILSNWGVNITSLIAGLGIGGVAIALAVQNILGDVMSAFSIYMDKPFVVGDFIVMGEHMGTVRKIGLKSTRIQALQGEEIIVSNKELTSVRIQNFKKMQERRVTFTIGVTYNTSVEHCRMIPEIIRKIFAEFENTRIEYIVFKNFAASNLNYEIVYYYTSGDYNQYIERQHLINIRIKEEFEKTGIQFAFPTQTLYLEPINVA